MTFMRQELIQDIRNAAGCKPTAGTLYKAINRAVRKQMAKLEPVVSKRKLYYISAEFCWENADKQSDSSACSGGCKDSWSGNMLDMEGKYRILSRSQVLVTAVWEDWPHAFWIPLQS